MIADDCLPPEVPVYSSGGGRRHNHNIYSSSTMPPLSRFGASKYRNATPHVTAKEEWYRGQLPPTTSSGSVTTFSSEVKTTREWVVTLTSGGELSWRSYKGEDVGKAKVGSGTVGDWDVSGLEGGLLAVGSTDGKVSCAPDYAETGIRVRFAWIDSR